jgi:Xaa-Pro aminopeptidase
VVAVEPGSLPPRYGGCRLEDIVLVTENGAEVLTEYPYDLQP